MKVTIKYCIKAVEMFNEGAISAETLVDCLIDYRKNHKCKIGFEGDVEGETGIIRLFLLDENNNEVRTVWARNKRTTVTTCINAAIAYNEGTMTEGEMLHILTDYDRCHKNSMLYDTSLDKVIRLYLVDENIITVKTVWRSDWPEGYKPPTSSETTQYIKKFGREVSAATYALMNKELFKMLDAYNDTHKSQFNIQINGVDYRECSEVYMTLYHIRREGDRNRTDRIIRWHVNVV